MARRLKTDAEFEATGWERDGDGDWSKSYIYFEQAMRKVDLKDVDITSHLNTNASVLLSEQYPYYYAGFGWSDDMFVIEPDYDGTALTVAIKHDEGKPPLELIPADALMEIAKVLEFGRKKYAADNWRSGGGFAWRRLIGAAFRHLLAFSGGQDNDPETGYSHIAHLGCCVLFLLEHILHGLGKDDRYKYPTKV